jgi:tetratricopeptide (TPR) repeat protein
LALALPGCSGCGGNAANTGSGGRSLAELLAAGEEALTRGEAEEALARFDDAVAADGDSSQARERRAAAYLRLGKPDRAVDDCIESLRINNRLAAAYFTRGQAYLALGEIEKARDDHNKALELAPDRPEWHAARGMLYHRMAHASVLPKEVASLQQNAMSDFTRAIKAGSRDEACRTHRAELYLDQGDYQNAVADCDHVLGNDPNLPAAHVTRARAHIELGDCDKAVIDCDSAIQLDDKRIDAYVFRAKARLERTPELRSPADIAEYRLAEADCRRAIELHAPVKGDPDATRRSKRACALAHELRGTMHDAIGSPKKALAEFDKAASLDPFLSSTLLCRAIARTGIDDFQGALNDCNAALSIDGTRADAYLARGRVLAQKLRFDEAVKDYTQALALKPQFAKAYLHRAIAYVSWARQGVLEAARARDRDAVDAALKRAVEYQQKCIDDLGKAIEFNPHYSRAYIIRGLRYAKMKQLDKALADFNAAIRVDPRAARAYSNRGVLRFNQRRYDEAIADFTAVIGLEPTGPDGFKRRALAYQAKDDKISAAADFKKADELIQKLKHPAPVGSGNADQPPIRPDIEPDSDVELPVASQAFEDAKKELEAALDAPIRAPERSS